MENRETIAGIPITDLKKLAIKYIGNDDYSNQQLIALKINTAQCARLSYTTFGDTPKIDYEKDIKLHDQLLQSKHFSPFEHCSRAMSEEEYFTFIKGKMMLEDLGDGIKLVNDSTSNLGWCNNFKGFIPYRYLIEK